MDTDFDHLKSKEPLEFTAEDLEREEMQLLRQCVHGRYTSYRTQLMRNLESYNHTEIVDNLVDRHNGSIH